MAKNQMGELDAYRRASERLLGLIQGEPTASANALSASERALGRIARSRALLEAFGNPQRGYPVVHVTGTSGKGSTSAAIAAMLTAAGYRVGLRTSPYLQVATEKLQIGSTLIDAESLDRVSTQVIDKHRHLFSLNPPGPRLGYADAWSVMTFLWFAERQVDVAVVEVGAGGRFDATNVCDPAVSVITSVGLDHVVSLGPTIGDIAWHKAGIIKPGTTAVVGDVPAEAWTVISEEAHSAGAKLKRVQPIACRSRGLAAMPGAFQDANAAVAVAAIEALRDRGFGVPEAAIDEGLAVARLPGRLERMPAHGYPVIWIDGAHNIDKIAALAAESPLLSGDGPLPVVVLGVLTAKDTYAIASGLSPIASAIVATEPEVVGRKSLPASELAATVRASGYAGWLHVEPDPERALLVAESLAASLSTNVLVTGSMYLAGQVRRRWYPDAAIVIQRTPWPTTRPERRSGVP